LIAVQGAKLMASGLGAAASLGLVSTNSSNSGSGMGLGGTPGALLILALLPLLVALFAHVCSYCGLRALFE
jgi:hypothetical protein